MGSGDSWLFSGVRTKKTPGPHGCFASRSKKSVPNVSLPICTVRGQPRPAIRRPGLYTSTGCLVSHVLPSFREAIS
jgi:hypothetical protein